MFKFKLENCERKEGYNNGMYAQAIADYTLTKKIRVSDAVKFDEGSDIPELRVSVKAERFTLALNVNGSTVVEQLIDYEARTASTGFVFVSKDGYGYGMNKTEFMQFLKIGCRSSLTDTSGKNNQPIQKVVRGSEESATGKIRKFLDSYNPDIVSAEIAYELFLNM